jgi:hypothetical protein
MMLDSKIKEGQNKMMILKKSLMFAAMVAVLAVSGMAQAPPEIKAKLDAQIKLLQAISVDPQVVSAVRAHNATPPSGDAASMTNEKWAGLSLLDPFVRTVAKTPLSVFLKTKTDDVIAEIFVSGTTGDKVGFAAKTTYWTHKGMPKHEVPMSGHTFIGAPKLDESTGVTEIQVGLPVMDGGKAIGSIVFGLRVDKLR